MNLAKTFPTDKERDKAINHLASLSRNPDWNFLVEKIIEPDIKEISEEILNTIFENPDDEKDLKRKRAYWIILKRLPEELIMALKENKEEVLEYDPYFKKKDMEKNL